MQKRRGANNRTKLAAEVGEHGDEGGDWGGLDPTGVVSGVDTEYGWIGWMSRSPEQGVAMRTLVVVAVAVAVGGVGGTDVPDG